MKTVFATPMFATVFILANILCSAQEDDVSEAFPVRMDAKHLPNAMRIHSKVISGGQPNGEQAFAELQRLGVRTIVSVDGAKPEVTLARKYGLRYVHLPHGYDGIGRQRSAELAKALRDFEGPIYFHCHHGKHRSPAAAAVACVAAGFIEPKSALQILKFAGTNENYRGLFSSVANAKRIDDADLDAMQVEFVGIAKLAPMAEAMVNLDQTFDHLRQFEAASWAPLPKHPDLEASHEALLLREHFIEIQRLDGVAKQPDGFRRLLSESESDAQRLETELRNWTSLAKREAAPKEVETAFHRISKNCTSCHRQYRDQINH